MINVILKEGLYVKYWVLFWELILKVYLQPHTSDPTPQKAVPTKSPTFCLRIKKGPLNLNSLITGGMIRLVTIYSEVRSHEAIKEEQHTCHKLLLEMANI